MFITVSDRPVAHEDAIFSLRWRGDTILTTGADSKVNLWSPKDLSLPTKVLQSSGVQALSSDIDCKSSSAITGMLDGNLYVFDLEGKEEVPPISLHPLSCWSLRCHPSLSHLTAVGLRSGEAGIIDMSLGKLVKAFDSHHKDYVYSITFNPRGDRLALSQGTGDIAVYDVDSGKLLLSTQVGNEPVRCIEYSSNGDVVLTACNDGYVRAYDERAGGIRIGGKSGGSGGQGGDSGSSSSSSSVRSGECIHTFKRLDGWATCVRANPNGKQILTAGGGQVTLWDWRGMKEALHTFTVDPIFVWDACYNDDGTMFATGSGSGTLSIHSCKEK